jgi:hypothetical protein
VAIKARKVPEETLEYERFKERITEMLDALASEKKVALDEKTAADLELAKDAADGNVAPSSSNAGAVDGVKKTAPPVEGPEAYWHKVAERNFIAHCFLIPEPTSETALVSAIQSTPIAAMRGTPGSQYMLIHFDQKLSGEPTSKPSLRHAPFSDDKYVKLVKSAIKARSGDEHVLLERGSNRGSGRIRVGIT